VNRVVEEGSKEATSLEETTVGGGGWLWEGAFRYLEIYASFAYSQAIRVRECSSWIQLGTESVQSGMAG